MIGDDIVELSKNDSVIYSEQLTQLLNLIPRSHFLYILTSKSKFSLIIKTNKTSSF